jgi:Family of unknown function (DUF6178)
LLPFELPTEDDLEVSTVSLSMLFLTAVANQLLGRQFTPTPLSAEDLILLKAQTLSGGELAADFSKQLYSMIEKQNLNCGYFIEFCLECWQEDLHIVDLDNLDEDDQLCLLVNPD